MVTMVVRVLLSTTNYSSTWRGAIAPEIALTKSVIINQRTRKHMCLFGFLHKILTVSVTESSDSSG